MGGEWLDAWEVEREARQDRRNAMIDDDRPSPSEYMDPPEPDWDERDAERESLDALAPVEDWWFRKYGPDPADVAAEKHRFLMEQIEDEAVEDYLETRAIEEGVEAEYHREEPDNDE